MAKVLHSIELSSDDHEYLTILLNYRNMQIEHHHEKSVYVLMSQSIAWNYFHDDDNNENKDIRC